MKTIKTDLAIVVEGRDDVAAVSRACDTLIIPTHGFGITAETWGVIEKAYRERGIIILTDPDFSGEEIRRKLTERFPDALQAYIAREDAMAADDIGVENAEPEIIGAAVAKALERAGKTTDGDCISWTYNDLAELRLVGVPEADARRSLLCAKLGIGYGNGKALAKKLTYWKVGREEIEQAIKEIE